MTGDGASLGTVAVVRGTFERFAAGDVESVMATWADDAEWHVLDAGPLRGSYSKLDYFTKVLPEFAASHEDYELTVESVTAHGPELVVVHVRSTGSNIDPDGGLMIYRVVDGEIVEGWALSRGRDARLPF